MTTTTERVVHGARCTWWNLIGNAATTPTGLPVCPYCRSPLFEVPGLHTWWYGAEQAVEAGTVADDYLDFLEWLQGRCFRNMDLARTAYDARARRTTTSTPIRLAVERAGRCHYVLCGDGDRLTRLATLLDRARLADIAILEPCCQSSGEVCPRRQPTPELNDWIRDLAAAAMIAGIRWPADLLEEPER